MRHRRCLLVVSTPIGVTLRVAAAVDHNAARDCWDVRSRRRLRRPMTGYEDLLCHGFARVPGDRLVTGCRVVVGTVVVGVSD